MSVMEVVEGQQNFVYVTNKPDQAEEWLRKSRSAFNTWIIPPEHDRVGLGALEIIGWQFFLCSEEDIATAVAHRLPAYLDSRIRR